MPVKRIVIDKENSTQSKIRRITPKQKQSNALESFVFKILAALGGFFLCFSCIVIGIIISPTNTVMSDVDNGDIPVFQNISDDYVRVDINQPVTVEGLEFIIHEQFLITDAPAEAPYKYIAFDVEIINHSSQSKSIYLNTWLMKDDLGRQYGQDYFASLLPERGTMGGELLPGSKMRGIVAFKTLPSAKYEFVFTDPTKKMIVWSVNNG